MGKLVGLTGGIGSGKTTVALMFAALGVPVYNSDTEAKRLMETSGEVKKALIDLLGNQAYEGQRLNKTYISKRVFATKSLLDKINSIVHPAVRKHFLAWAERQETVYVIQEAAIIFEIGSQDFYDKTILITAPESARIERIKKRDAGLSEEDIKARMRNQWNDSEKMKRADYIIENLDLEKTEALVFEVHQELSTLLAQGEF
ncbi:MAG: dephospho-CoA kinase [Pricia sp.]